ncbi:MAG: hypothetical protein H7281_18630 [Bacteriovorax sp.]|nr:hypothetical protein [Bacteriovorax sp.]
MKNHWNSVRHLILSLSLVVTSIANISNAFAQTDTSLDQQKTDCSKNTASEWSDTMNKCVGKVDDRKTRHDVIDCNKIADLTQKADCHKKIAEQKTGLNSDPNSLNQGSTNKSMMMNGINTAYAVLDFINVFGSKKTKSPCMSKKIFGVTALAGTLSDFYLKARARSKVKDLTNKYKLDVKTGSHDAQMKAFEYLKDEQNTVIDIASMEKKRNMLLMLGYGAATVMAIYEMTYAPNAACTKPEKEDKKPEDCTTNPEQEKCSTSTTFCPDGSEAKSPADCKQPAVEDSCTTSPDQEKCSTSTTFCADGSEAKSPADCKQPAVEDSCATNPDQEKCSTTTTFCADGSEAKSTADCKQPTPTPVAVTCASNPDQPNCPKPVASVQEGKINSTEKTVNGKKIALYKTSVDGQTYDIVDNKLYPAGKTTSVGTIDYSSGEVRIGDKVVSKITQVTGANTAWVPDGNLIGIHNKMSPKLGK